jgi:hypothetical protein
VRKIWNITVDGRQHEVDVSLDLTLSGGGRIVLDGVVVESWSFGVKGPGTVRSFIVGTSIARITQGLFDFDLHIDGVEIPQPRQAPWKRSSRSILVTAVLAGLSLLFVIAVFAAIFYFHG